MSQSVLCDRCKKLESMTQCAVCLDMGDVVNLCHDCFGSHYILMHHVNPSAPPGEGKMTDEQLKKYELSLTKMPFSFGDTATDHAFSVSARWVQSQIGDDGAIMGESPFAAMARALIPEKAKKDRRRRNDKTVIANYIKDRFK
jgi:hypothetical protein